MHVSELHIEVNGSGPDLVLLHGWGLNLRVWDGLVAELRDRFRLITVDLPGHGRSSWKIGRGTPAEQAWLVHQALEPISTRYSLLGWSMGAQVALDLAAATPGQIDRLMLVAATPKFVASADWLHGMQPTTIAKLANQLRTDYQRTVSDFLDLQTRGSVESASVLSQLRNALFVHGQAQPKALDAGLRNLAASDLRATASHVQAPTLVIAGQYDRVTPPSASRALAGALPDARYVELRRSGHAPFLSHRQEFAAILVEFLLPSLTAHALNAAAPQAAEVRDRADKNLHARPPVRKKIRAAKVAPLAVRARAGRAGPFEAGSPGAGPSRAAGRVRP
jgi:pimeloyl-[acyl-carrier protein] methyl ester esterase